MDLEQALAEVAEEQRVKLSIGDIVQLKSGGIEMVVCGVTERSVERMWHTTAGFLQCTSIAMGCLVLVKR
jgi:uncharacterized protein YodC (DUF2158 family)